MIDEIMDFDGMASLSLTSTNDVDSWIAQLKKKEPLSLKEVDNLCKKVKAKALYYCVVDFTKCISLVLQRRIIFLV